MGGSKNFNHLLIKYSDAKINLYFLNHIKNSSQISIEYSSDPIKLNRFLNNVVARHIRLRDALIDPLNPNNKQYIEDHHKYFFDPNNQENGQARGPQVHISQQMCSDFGFAGNKIEFSGLSATYLSSLVPVYSANTPRVLVPSSFSVASPHSFRQGIENTGINLYSGMTGDTAVATDDNTKNFPFVSVCYKNLTLTQKVCDLVRTPYYFDKKGNRHTVGVEEDIKNVTAQKIAYSNEAKVGIVGSINLNEEKMYNRMIAMKAITGQITTKHIDPSKDNDVEKNKILNLVVKTGEMEHAKDILGVPVIVSNRHADPNP